MFYAYNKVKNSEKREFFTYRTVNFLLKYYNNSKHFSNFAVLYI